LRVFEDRVLRRILGPKRDVVTGKWRKLHSGELHNLYSSPDIIRQIKSRKMRGWGMWYTWEREEKCTGFWWKCTRPLERLRRRWEDGIRMDLTLIGWKGGVEWIYLVQVRDRWQAVVNAVMNLCVLVPWT
jgi:hypothetical protein